MRWALGALVLALSAPALGAAPRDEDAIFGGDAEGSSAAPRDEDAIFGGDAEGGSDAEGAPTPRAGGEGSWPGGAGAPDAEPFATEPDPLVVGGQLYLRFLSQISERGGVLEQPLSMPNILDLYLDARPEERVRAFFNGRLRFDPTVKPGATDAFGRATEEASVLVDQLWLKTDIARSVFLTVGQQRIKWGSSRLWTPTDFINTTKRAPLALFDERTGVPLIKAHIPIESLGWNAYAFALLEGAETLEDIGGALRLEVALPSAELTFSAAFGKGRETSLGADLSAALGPLDLSLEVALTDETESLEYHGALDLDAGVVPTSSPRGAWMGRATLGVEYQFKPNDDDVMVVGAEYFYNSTGYEDSALYPWLAIVGQLQPFYLGRHYAALFVLAPSPGSWDDLSLGLSALANLSDQSVITRLDLSLTLHTRLRLEAYAQVHYGHKGGELRFSLEVPDLPPVPGLLDEGLEGFSIPAPLLSLGLNLRVSI